MASIRKHGKAYQVRWYTLAGPETSTTAPNAATAAKLARAVEEALALGREYKPAVTGDEPTVRHVAEAYIARRRVNVRKNTLRMDAICLDVFQRFAATKMKTPTVSLLSRPLLDEYLVWLSLPETSVHGKAREGVTINKLLRGAQRLWVWAEQCDRWPGLIPRPRLLDKHDIPDSHPGAVVAPTWDEMDRCIAQCNAPHLKRLATWLRYTGLRVGESMRFEWRDIDMERGELTIRPDVDKKKIGRVIPLGKLILDEIATWGKREGYVLPSSRQKGVREREARGRDMARAWKRAGVREAVYKRRPDHSFRKGVKSELLHAGAHPDAVDYLQGHTLGAGSRGRYIDATRLPLAAVLALIPPIDTATTNVVRLPTRPRTDKGRTGLSEPLAKKRRALGK